MPTLSSPPFPPPQQAIKVSTAALSSLSPSFRYHGMSSLHHKHIIAQSHYRLQSYSSSIDSYASILSYSNSGDPEDFEDPEVLTNMLAGLISSEDYSLSSLSRYASPAATSDDYDLLFNLASAHAVLGDYKTAATTLNSADESCRRMCSDNDEYEVEVSSVQAQQAYVLLGLGDHAASAEAYSELAGSRATKVDTALNFAVVNNLAASDATAKSAGGHARSLEPAYKAAKDRLNSVQARQAEVNLRVLKLLAGEGAEQEDVEDIVGDDVIREMAIKVEINPSKARETIEVRE